jgi:flagellar basal body P-ring formation protein FlgA
MSNRFYLSIYGLFVVMCSARLVDAEFSVKVLVERTGKVVEASVRLGAIARIATLTKEGYDLLPQIEQLEVGRIAFPGDDILISGEKIAELLNDLKLASAGASSPLIGYEIPSQVKVTRIGRTVAQSELENALMAKTGEALEITSLRSTDKGLVYPQLSSLEVVGIEQLSQGARRVTVKVRSSDGEELLRIFDVKINYIAELPILARAVNKGEALNAEDVVMARFSGSAIPSGVAKAIGDIEGKVAIRALSAGEAIVTRSLESPKVLVKGSTVSATYTVGGLLVTARVQALEDGAPGTIVQVRNTATQRVIEGRVTENGLVEVLP